MSRYVSAAFVTAILLIGYIAGANANWFFNAIYVARVTGRPVIEVIDPLHRPWLQTAVEVSTVPPVEQDDEELAIAVEQERG